MLHDKTTLIGISASVDELIQLMKANPFGADHADLILGRKTVVVFSDQNKLARLTNGTSYLLAKQKCLRLAVEDLASGGPLLMKSVFGVRLTEGEPEVFIQSTDSKSLVDNLLFQLSLKDAVTFRQEKESSSFEIHEQTTHATIYYLIYLLATVETAS